MWLLRRFLQGETARMHENNVRIRVIGDRSTFSPDIVGLIEHSEQMTSSNDRLHLTAALSYGGRQEIVEEQRKFLAPYDETIIVARGPILDDEGAEWQGSANLICMPSRRELQNFMAEWPYCKNDLYEDVLVERYRFGGRPGQTV